MKTETEVCIRQILFSFSAFGVTRGTRIVMPQVKRRKSSQKLMNQLLFHSGMSLYIKRIDISKFWLPEKGV